MDKVINLKLLNVPNLLLVTVSIAIFIISTHLLVILANRNRG